MDFRKRLLAILTIVCVMAGILYVGGSGMQVQNATEHNLFARDKETIYFWYSDESMTDFLNRAAVSFSEERDARVLPVLVSNDTYLEDINEASLLGEQVPDVYIVSNDSLEKAYLAGLASEIRDEAMICTEDNFPITALNAVTYKDKMVAYPYYYETSAFLYNKTYLEAWVAEQVTNMEEGEADSDTMDAEESSQVTMEQIENGIPTTMDEVLAFANNYDAPENVEAVFRWDVSDIFYNYCFVGNYMVVGGETGDDESNISIYNEETKKCLEIYQNLNQFFYIESDSVTYESVVQDFIDGKIVFTIATTDVIAKLEAAKADGSFAYEYGIGRIPAPSAELAGRSLSVTNCVVINGYSEHKDLANEFATYLTGEYFQDLYARCGKASANYAANPENAALMMFMKEYENADSLPKMIQTSNFWIQLEILFSRVWEGGDADALLLELSDQIFSQVKDAVVLQR